MDKFNIIFQKDSPKYMQIAIHIEELIQRGMMEDRDKLPSIRKLSHYLGVNKDTVIMAYNKLCQHGVCYQKLGSGTYVKSPYNNRDYKKVYAQALKKLNLKHHSYIDFVGDSIREEFFPIEDFKKCINYIMDRDGAKAFLHNDAKGFEGLRKTINEAFWDNKYLPGDFLIISGAQQGIDLISRTLINSADNVVVESPTYNGALNVFNWRKANVIDIPLQEDGIDLDKFEKVLMKNDIKCFYTMSSLHNPTGICYSYEKKKRILELAEIYNFYILEDDYMSELIYHEKNENTSFKYLDNNNKVIYVKSFSKTFLPGIRLGYLLLPKELKEMVLNFKINTDISTSSIMQRALEVYIKKAYWKTHVKKLRTEYEKRYSFLVEIIQKELQEHLQYTESKGGLSVYLTIKNNMNSMELFEKGFKQGVVITPGVFFYKNPEDGYKHFKIGFARATEADMVTGLAVIKNIFNELKR
ncbi:MocR-like pyridoxine biosynthesis transcription factor PdxR [Hathewaya proteolytica]|nr:PLP-dependent aminotransferase family protein [Hathewaya proteolytica]